MERLTNISEQLKSGDKFYLIDGENFHQYEYLCVHPHNRNYILALDYITQDAKKLYINKLLEEKYYVGEYDNAFIKREELKYHQKEVTRLSNELLSMEVKPSEKEKKCKEEGKDCWKCDLRCIHNPNDPEKYPQE